MNEVMNAQKSNPTNTAAYKMRNISKMTVSGEKRVLVDEEFLFLIFVITSSSIFLGTEFFDQLFNNQHHRHGN